MMKKKKKSRAKIIIWTVAALLIICFTALRIFRPIGAGFTEVKTATGDITTYYSFSGYVAAKKSQILYADRALQIKTIEVSKGQSVKSGDILMKTTAGQKITAPFDGTVSQLDAVPNAQLTPGAQLCKVVDYANLQMAVQVDEYDISAVTVGKAATVTINALARDIAGTVDSVSRDGIYQNGVTYFNSIISLPSDNDLMVGMSAQARILDKRAKNTVMLPMTAIQFNRDNDPFVFMREGRGIKQVGITLGINDGTNVQITRGLINGDTILVPAAASAASATGGPFGGMFRGLRGNRGSSGNGTGSNSTGGAGTGSAPNSAGGSSNSSGNVSSDSSVPGTGSTGSGGNR
ncbi:MAG TPA: efflux RND transporter periplasmic adaptor subunit [Clostridia bacterium]|nr:efflux RND transporter periplasmic adaptor subunit [Clostridia bacterium]